MSRDTSLQPRAVCDNVAAICAHLQQQLHAAGPSVALQVVPPLANASSCSIVGPHFVVDTSGGHWRCTRFVEGSVSLEVISSTSLATSVAAAFGHFSSCMRSFTGSLVDTIPCFHNTPRRLVAWQHALDSCTLPDRLLASQHYVTFVRERSARAGALVDAMRSGRIPTSVSHNDAKIGNVLLKKDDHSFMCIIDFDTTMQGTPLCVN
jgi:aminoglycoside phosphotransferase (APT) family kinase protein